MSSDAQIGKGLLALERRVWVDCTITLKEPLHIGAGRDPASPMDLKITRDARGKPVIPGSSLKGFLRSYIARLLQVYLERGVSTLNVDGIEIPLVVGDTKDVGNSEQDDSSKQVDSLNAPDSLSNVGESELPILDRIFGYAGRGFSLASRLRVTEAKPISEPPVISRTHVSLDRVSDAARRKMLVSVEAVDGKAGQGGASGDFRFTIVFDEISDPYFADSNKLFYLVILRLLNSGIEEFIGGWKSRGYGLVQIKLDKIRVIELDGMIQGKEPEEVTYEELIKRVSAGWR